jgi:hypothetical protein
LARAICGGWWADRFTLAFPFRVFEKRLFDAFMTCFFALQKPPWIMDYIDGVRLTGFTQRCGMTAIIEAAFPFHGIRPPDLST